MTVYRGRLVAWNGTTYLAEVRLDGSPAQTLTGVTASRAIPSAEMTAGRRVLLDTGDHGDPTDFVVTAVYV